MRYAWTAALVAVAFSSACSTVKETQHITSEVARVPVADLHGLSRAELESRLRLKPASRLSVVEARMEGEAVATRVIAWRMARDTPCPRSVARPQLAFEQGGVSLSVPEFNFVGGRVAAVTHRSTRSDGIAGSQEIVVTCSERRASNDDQVRDALGYAIFGPVLLPFAGVLSVTNTVTAHDINTPLSKLPLGSEPPGGLAAYVAELPDGAVLVSHEGGIAQIDFHYHLKDGVPQNQRGAGDASVHFESGRVAKLTSNKDCVLTEQRTFSCERGFP